jgi:hypothetical protein
MPIFYDRDHTAYIKRRRPIRADNDSHGIAHFRLFEYWGHDYEYYKKHKHREIYFEDIVRGYQDICMKCQKDCKILGAPNSSVICYEFKKKAKENSNESQEL